MGFFGRKKKKVLPEQPLAVPPFPHRGTTFPSYDSPLPKQEARQEFPDIHKEVTYYPEQEQEEGVAKEAKLLDRSPPRHQEALNLPVREPAFLRNRTYPEREALASKDKPDLPLDDPAAQALHEQWQREGFKREPPVTVRMPQQPPVTRQAPQSLQPSTAGDKPLFVKIGQYRDAMASIQLLKQKLQETEALLAKLEDLKTKEQAELDTAKTNLTMVKEKLLSIDKQLFEA